MSTGTWQRIERGDEVELASLVTAVVALWGDAAIVDDLLARRDPDVLEAQRRLAAGMASPDDKAAVRDEITRLQDRIEAADLVTHAVQGVIELVVALKGDVETLNPDARVALSHVVGAIDAMARRLDAPAFTILDPEQFAQAAHGGATETQEGTVDKPPATSGFDPDES